MSQWAVPKLFVGKNAANTLSAATNAITSMASVASQDIYFIDADGGATHGNILDATTMAAVSKFSVVGTSLDRFGVLKPFVSEPITKTNILKTYKDAYTAASQQITYLGYDGVTATKDLTVTNGNAYRMQLSIKVDNAISEFKEPFGPIYGAQTGFAASTPTLQEKLDYIWQYVKVINGDTSMSNFFGNTKKRTGLSTYFKAEMLSNAVGTAFTNTITIANGGTLLTSTAHGRAVGDYIRIGATAATVTTNSIYRVSQVIDANNLVIESPYQGTTLSAAAATNAAYGLGTNSSVGIKVTGKDVPFQRYSQKQVVRFFASFFLDDATRNSTSSGFSATATTTEAVFGSGTPDQVKEKEISYFGYTGLYNYDVWPNIEPQTYSDSTLTYDFFSIEYTQTSNNDFAQGKKLKVVELALVVGASQNTALTLVIAALPNYIVI